MQKGMNGKKTCPHQEIKNETKWGQMHDKKIIKKEMSESIKNR